MIIKLRTARWSAILAEAEVVKRIHTPCQQPLYTPTRMESGNYSALLTVVNSFPCMGADPTKYTPVMTANKWPLASWGQTSVDGSRQGCLT